MKSKNVGKRMRIFEIKHLTHFVRACVSSNSAMHFYMYKRKQLKHCYDDPAKTFSHRIPVLTSNIINFAVKNN